MVYPPKPGTKPTPPPTGPGGGPPTGTGHTNCSGHATGGTPDDLWPDINRYYWWIRSKWTKTDCAIAGTNCLTFIIKITYEVTAVDPVTGEPTLKLKSTSGQHVAKVLPGGAWDDKPGDLPVRNIDPSEGRKIFDTLILGKPQGGITLSPDGTALRTGGLSGLKVGDLVPISKIVCYCP